jgi:hypothetical protein
MSNVLQMRNIDRRLMGMREVSVSFNVFWSRRDFSTLENFHCDNFWELLEAIVRWILSEAVGLKQCTRDHNGQ